MHELVRKGSLCKAPLGADIEGVVVPGLTAAAQLTPVNVLMLYPCASQDSSRHDRNEGPTAPEVAVGNTLLFRHVLTGVKVQELACKGDPKHVTLVFENVDRMPWP